MSVCSRNLVVAEERLPAACKASIGQTVEAFETTSHQDGVSTTILRPTAEDSNAPMKSSALDDVRAARAELERPIKANVDLGGSTQFGRASMRREANREVREARLIFHADIGAA